MDHLKLYKDLRSHTPREHIRITRNMQETNRNKQRMDRYQDSRHISPIPVRLKEEVNTGKEIANETATDADQKLKNQQVYINRFVEWKENKKNILKKQQMLKKKPFISTVNNGRDITSSCSFVPRNHHKGFQPPAGLKNPTQKENVAEKEGCAVEGRKSIYTVVPTPPRKRTDTNVQYTKQFPLSGKALSNNVNARNLNNNKTLNISTNLARNFSKTTATKINLVSAFKNERTITAAGASATSSATTVANKPNGTTNFARNASKTTATKINLVSAFKNERTITAAGASATSSATTVANKPNGTTNFARNASKTTATKINLVSAFEKEITSTAAGASSTSEATNKPNFTNNFAQNVSEITTTQINLGRAFDKGKTTMTAKASSKTSSTAVSNKETGAIAKFKAIARKHTTISKHTKKNLFKSDGAHLAQNLKAKTTKANPTVQIKSKIIKNLIKDHQTIKYMVIQTPRDFATLNPFDEFVTSTKIKDSSHENVTVLNSIKMSKKKSNKNSSAKRNILHDATHGTHVKVSDQKAGKISKVDDVQSVVKKYNFIRYSNCNGNGEEMKNVSLVADSISKKDGNTPAKFEPEERPANYLSPFVSVTRGKVSMKKEKEKRNSIYLQNGPIINELSVTNSPKNSVKVRRTLEATRYFRKQLQDQIDRLHKLCDIWETYKIENLERIENANGEDMINVTIGQTRLLTSKKFMQFNGLINRCEAGATGKGCVEYDGSEDTKPINTEDLEGFWSMLGIQIDNLDKRFDNLNRWKLNEWNDPDEEQPKMKLKLTKVKKTKAVPATKAKPNSALQQMLRKMQDEMQKKKNKKDNFNEDKVVSSSKTSTSRLANTSKGTPLKSGDNSTTGRISIIVKDRKYFSPAATVLSVSTTNSKALKSSQNSPKIFKHLQKFNEALDNMQSAAGLRKSPLINENSQQNVIETKTNDRQTSLDSTVESNKGNIVEVGLSPQSPLPTGRKSILKTPGTAKNRQRNVIFNEKLCVKKFNFLIDEYGDPFNDKNGEYTHEEDLAKSFEESPQINDCSRRTLTLRNRKVRLRPSTEIVIPLK